MAQTVTKTFSESFAITNGGFSATCDLVSETQSGSSWVRTYTIEAGNPRTGIVTLNISIPSNAVITKVEYSNTPSVSGKFLQYSNVTMQLPDYGNRYASNSVIKDYLNASHPSSIRFYWYCGYVSQTTTRTESSSVAELQPWYAWTANISGVAPRVKVTYTVAEEEATLSYGTSNVWQKCKIYVAADNTWKKVKAYFGTGGSWKQVK